MPELPEVEITRRGIAPLVAGRAITAVTVRDRRLRWPVAADLGAVLRGRRIHAVGRRGKYLLLDCGRGTLIVHLGMSGSLRVVGAGEPPGPYDHFDLGVGDLALRLRDPRRSGAHLRRVLRGRRAAVKLALMDHEVVVGIGNIYATESLFRAGINPKVAAGRLSARRCERLAAAVRATLDAALAAGGSTLRDFAHADGSPGYFQQQYFAYGRGGLPCRRCGTPIRRFTQGQRSTFYCPRCQRY